MLILLFALILSVYIYSVS